MPKLVLNDLTQLSSNEASAVASINANNTATETAMENTLSRDGTSPNTMEADIDMDGTFTLLNLPDAVDNSQPVTLRQLNASADGIVNIKDEGTLVLASASDLNFTGDGVTVTDGGSGQANIAIDKSTTVLELTDTPSSFVAGDLWRVNSGATALERLAIGSAGQVLTVSGGLPIWSTPSQSSPIDPVLLAGRTRSTPSTATWTLTLNAGTSTAANVTSYGIRLLHSNNTNLHITSPAGVALSTLGITSTPWTVIWESDARLIQILQFGETGMAFRNSTNGRLLAVKQLHDDSPHFVNYAMERFTNATTFSATVTGAAIRSGMFGDRVLMSAVNDGTNLTYALFDPVTTKWIQIGSDPLASFVESSGTIDQLYLHVTPRSTSTMRWFCNHFEITNSSSTLTYTTGILN